MSKSLISDSCAEVEEPANQPLHQYQRLPEFLFTIAVQSGFSDVRYTVQKEKPLPLRHE